ncbi:hypothetical protein A1QI_14565 [Vibrio genomosp. F10 str. 9ZB36]|nr:hypothetical protein A1QK_18730 [Vibrio genomosp. F10 str. 9ZD137]OEF09409.1 hypothetical protein A1QI_14565 [Vibrio genomosp. F10 str. 9ZB36]
MNNDKHGKLLTWRPEIIVEIFLKSLNRSAHDWKPDGNHLIIMCLTFPLGEALMFVTNQL